MMQIREVRQGRRVQFSAESIPTIFLFSSECVPETTHEKSDWYKMFPKIYCILNKGRTKIGILELWLCFISRQISVGCQYFLVVVYI